MKGLQKIQVLLPKSLKPKGTAHTPTFAADNKNEVLKFADYQTHKLDLFDVRQEKNSQEIIQNIFSQDPDLANTVWSFLTVSATDPTIVARDAEDQLDHDAIKIVKTLLAQMTTLTDYTQGFVRKKTLNKLAEEMRHMLLLRGALGVEAIYNEMYMLSDLRHIDMYKVRWYEKESGKLKPIQETADKEINLDLPTFFYEDLYKLPTDAYASSPFTSAINAIAATQQVINDLYRIMQITGYPRLDVKVLEEVLIKNAPLEVQQNIDRRVAYINQTISQLTGQFYNLRPDLPAVHTDAVDLSMVNEKKPGLGIDISQVIKVLDAQKQSGLHTLATILGRGESGTNTATTEARLFTMSAAALNRPIGDVLSAILTQALRIMGNESRVIVSFPEPELRSDEELESQRVLRQQRLRSDLSYGLITDDEYHLSMYGRLPPEGYTPMSGTLFESGGGIAVDASKISPNSDPLGRSVSKASDKSAKSNSVDSSKKSRENA